MMLIVCPTCQAPIVFPKHLCGCADLCPNCRQDLHLPSQPMSDEEVACLVSNYLTSTSAFQKLTPRLREVLRMVADGCSTKKIAFRLKVTPKTVEFHRARLMKRLHIPDIASLARFAVRVGAVPP